MTIPVGVSIARVGHAMAAMMPADVVLALNPALVLATLVGLLALATAAAASAGLGERWPEAARSLRRRLADAKHRARRASKDGWPGAQTC